MVIKSNNSWSYTYLHILSENNILNKCYNNININYPYSPGMLYLLYNVTDVT